MGQPPARGPRVCARAARCCCGCSSMQALAFVFFTLVLPIEIVYAKETLDAGDSGYGALLSSWGVGHGRRAAWCSWPPRGASSLQVAARRQHGDDRRRLSRHGRGRNPRRGLRGRGRRRHRERRAVGRADERRPGADGQPLSRRGSSACSSRSAAIMPGVGFLLGGVIAELLNPRASFVAAGLGRADRAGRRGAAAAPASTGGPRPERDTRADAGRGRGRTDAFLSATQGPARPFEAIFGRWRERNGVLRCGCFPAGTSRYRRCAGSGSAWACSWGSLALAAAVPAYAVPRTGLVVGAGVAAGRPADPLVRELQRRGRGARLRHARRQLHRRAGGPRLPRARCRPPCIFALPEISAMVRARRGIVSLLGNTASALLGSAGPPPGRSRRLSGGVPLHPGLRDLPAVALTGAVLLGVELPGDHVLVSRRLARGRASRPCVEQELTELAPASMLLLAGGTVAVAALRAVGARRASCRSGSWCCCRARWCRGSRSRTTRPSSTARPRSPCTRARSRRASDLDAGAEAGPARTPPRISEIRSG